jgi:general stress protein 26
VVPAALPDEVERVLSGFLCCELATIASDGTPIAWPAVALHLPERSRFVLSTSIGFSAKAANIRRDPRVSLLFSDPTGSGLDAPPTVLMRGTATVAEGVRTWGDDLGAHWRRVVSLQPVSRYFSGSPPARWFMDWYFMRLVITVEPHELLWWPGGDTSRAPREWQEGAADVG